MAHTPRFLVCLYGRIAPTAALGTIDVTQSFTARGAAERFAREISRYLPVGPDLSGCVQSWVLVYALPIPGGAAQHDMLGHCYLSYNAGGECAKRHAILPGYYGDGSRFALLSQREAQ